ncbi:uncharacterized protein [Paramisgurnus dabryanus]|uniref:uncharacterized protein n=1 Tax=Paramisgurnus dabryanus TaxID=90735 RepID=UPI0031F3EE40
MGKYFSRISNKHLHNDTAMDLLSHLHVFILLLIKLSGTQDVTTVNKISVQKGQSILIPFLYKQDDAFFNNFLSAECHRFLNGYTKLSPPNNPKIVFLSDDKTHQIFTIRMDNVQESGDYMCAVRAPSGFEKQVRFVLEVTMGPSRLHVSNQNLIGSENNKINVTCYHHVQANVKWCKFGGQCLPTYGTLDGASVRIRYYQTNMTVTMNKLKLENTGWYWCSSGDLQMPVHITVKQKRSLTTTSLPQTGRKRTAVLFLLPIILEILLVVIIYAALRLFKICRERYSQPRNREAEDGQYVTMHRKRSSRSTGCTEAWEYENMTGLESNSKLQMEPEYVNVKTT